MVIVHEASKHQLKNTETLQVSNPNRDVNFKRHILQT